jgi:hypothetical protein
MMDSISDALEILPADEEEGLRHCDTASCSHNTCGVTGYCGWTA